MLTEGDEIALPVVLRNYLDRRQTLEVNLRPEPWFALTGASTMKVDVQPGDSAQAVFLFRALASVEAGVQQVSAANHETGDAIEKPVAVHPHGEERIAATGTLFDGPATLELGVPAEALPGTLRGQLKVYPNLFAHAMESVEGILRRPYGCGEQTISSTYPSLLVAAHYRDREGEKPAVAVRAERYLRMGYERLLGYRSRSGGFTYWGKGEPDLALTAYALRFLTGATRLLPVDPEVTAGARKYLVKRQAADGSWAKTGGEHALITTAYVARVLAASLGSEPAGAAPSEREAVTRALRYLAGKAIESDDPYVLASYALAASDSGEAEPAARARDRLRALAQHHNQGVYWSRDAATPFHGWGWTGSLERTALALQALTGSEKSAEDLVRRGLLFLLGAKDRYGVWYSGQATVNVLEALLPHAAAQEGSAARKLQVMVNGKSAGDLVLPASREVAGPVLLHLSQHLSPGANRIVIQQAADSPLASAQFLASYYVPWPEGGAPPADPGEGRGLHLAVDFSKTRARPGDEVRCMVKAQRLDHRSRGMLLAEVGLPPGADVDRASLEAAARQPGVDRYDVLPDRVVFYLWPSAAGAGFDFGFRPRFRIKARTTASALYDYYNPVARVAVPPLVFEVAD